MVDIMLSLTCHPHTLLPVLGRVKASLTSAVYNWASAGHTSTPARHAVRRKGLAMCSDEGSYWKIGLKPGLQSGLYLGVGSPGVTGGCPWEQTRTKSL